MAVQPPYLKPTIPFTGSIYGGLRDGMTVIICGTVQQCCKRFKIDFQCGLGPSPQPDVAFHCNPRFDEGCVVANSFEKGKWQCEERKQEMPFRKGYLFEARIRVNNVSFTVDVDGKYLLEFKHRIPLSRVDAISVSGEVEVASINFQSPTAVPYRGPIYGGLFPSKSVLVSGVVLSNATRFHINLQAGNTTALQVNPRFNENVVVRNSKLDGCWGSEERHLPAGMPLSPGQAFAVWIFCEPNCFKVAANGQHLFDYTHRFLPLQQIDQLEVEGDVTLSNVQVF